MPIIALHWAISARVAIEAARTLQNRGDGVERVGTGPCGLRLRITDCDLAHSEPNDPAHNEHEFYQATPHFESPQDAADN
jgi:hypothetical protein